jgi:hypothetical protein
VTSPVIYDTFLINGVNVLNYANIAEIWDGAKTRAPVRGSNLIIPGQDGEKHQPKTNDVPTLAVGLVVLAVDPTTGVWPADLPTRVAQLNSNVRFLTRLVGSRPDQPLVVTRRQSFMTGNEDHVALAEIGTPFAPTYLPNAMGARLSLELRILDGVWHGTTTSSQAVGVPQTVTSIGDTTTKRITAVFTGANTITNSTLGMTLSVSAACTVDVENYVCTSGSAQISGRFALAAGDNLCSAGAGTVDLTWTDAYL